MENFFDLTPERLREELAPVEARPFAAGQVLHWAYQRGVTEFAAMTNLAPAVRSYLAERLTLLPLVPVRESRSGDGVVKTLFRLPDGLLVEAVLIPEEGHNTLCISSQAGCAMGCDYCETAKMGLARDLTRGEILAQVAAGVRLAGGRDRLRNLVFMGMGEPMNNLDQVIPALRRILAADGFGFTPRRVTVSTCGVVPGIERLGKEKLGVNLAVSLNASRDQVRDRLMPVNRRWPLAELLFAVRRFSYHPRQRPTLAYVLMEGVNDRAEDARQLVSLAAPLRAKVNLIPYNRTTGGYRRPSPRVQEEFLQLLVRGGLTVTVREGRGEEIGAACGQLRAQHLEDEDAGKR